MGLFSWFNRSPDKYYKTKGGDHWYIRNSNAIEDIPFKDLQNVYRLIPHLRSVIDKKAEYFANGIVELVDIDSEGNETVNTTHDLNKVLESPNFMQTMKSMMYMTMIYKCIAGDAFLMPIYKVGHEARNLSKLWVIPFSNFKVHTHKENILQTVDIKQYIKSYEFWTENPDKHFFINDPKDVIHIRDYGTSYNEGHSKIVTLREPIQNIYKALKSRGLLASRQGGIGILTKDNRGAQFDMPIDNKDKENLEDKVNSKSLNSPSGAIHVTDIPLRWQSMVFSTKDLMLFEEIQDDFATICDQYGLDRETFNGDVKFSNKETADKNNYQNTIIPEWADFADSLTNKFNLLKDKMRIRVNHSHIQVLQTDKKAEEETRGLKAKRLLEELDRKIITIEEYKEQMYEG